MTYAKEGVCIDCGKVFLRRSEQQQRCPECQREHKRQLDRARYERHKEEKKKEKKHEKKEKVIEGAVYINGHPQICTHFASCYYGSVNYSGCSYLIETGKSRINQGYYIVDGICPCYKEKSRGRSKRQEPLTFTFGVADKRRT